MTLPLHHLCHGCGQDCLQQIDGFSQLPRVTSDSKPFRQGGKLFVCANCGTVQKIADSQWLEEIGQIYRDYDMYHQSTSNDQPVFDPVSGRPSGRCEVLARHLRESGFLPDEGALLDVGAGSGAMLGAFSSACVGWQLFGLDLDGRKEASLRAIPRFEQLFTVPPEQLPGKFDLVTLIHSLEHFTDPMSMLKALHKTLSESGQLFIQVNNVERTPFDLVVADHLCHFTPRSLAYMVGSAGLGVRSVRTDWVNKEISLLASGESVAPSIDNDNAQQAADRTKRDVIWLNGMLAHARETARNGHFGIFGTSVAATWLASALGDAVEFFVDEDPARTGRSHFGRPIVRPDEVPDDGTVYLAFVQEISISISQRLSHLHLNFASPQKIT